MKKELIEKAFELAKERYAAIGVDVEAALEKLQKVQLSLHCWQADDVTGFENAGALTVCTGRVRSCGHDACGMRWVLFGLQCVRRCPG